MPLFTGDVTEYHRNKIVNTFSTINGDMPAGVTFSSSWQENPGIVTPLQGARESPDLRLISPGQSTWPPFYDEAKMGAEALTPTTSSGAASGAVVIERFDFMSGITKSMKHGSLETPSSRNNRESDSPVNDAFPAINPQDVQMKELTGINIIDDSRAKLYSKYLDVSVDMLTSCFSNLRLLGVNSVQKIT
ncbi:hypothetical protein APICC_00607 [Apis cerana cerana]|uniref:Uncharacterized protein n=1 Tax=Apis cerana cerana TaxID=94128 RepID=A0A2A3EPL4_APICC|nr:hypothetical protein APICC_00607 [Apis cerana cerana]